ncbi:hypothetical protein DPMN_048267 [Dreissena polymorpha]|uniref:Uncharacterized protein n=1 Tax=Dreissena polymorpha TaxID=45954 RepID=A0A9D4DAC9_DREPO|nr:hypothetical protein DPMN_048267 [Dreissena polymorpha]
MLGGVGALLGTASTYPGGLQLFQKNTSENLCVMAGAGTSIGMWRQKKKNFNIQELIVFSH